MFNGQGHHTLAANIAHSAVLTAVHVSGRVRVNVVDTQNMGDAVAYTWLAAQTCPHMRRGQQVAPQWRQKTQILIDL